MCIILYLISFVCFTQKSKEHVISYGATHFKDAQVSVKEICEQMKTEAVVLDQNRVQTRKEADIDGNALPTEMESLPEFPKAMITSLYPQKGVPSSSE